MVFNSNKNDSIMRTCVIIFSVIAFIVSIVCFCNNYILSGFIILVSFLLIDICCFFMMFQQRRLDDMHLIKSRGSMLKHFKCDLAIGDDEYKNGHLICYENGFLYEHNNYECIDFVRYSDVVLISFVDDKIVLENMFSHDNIILKSNKSLRISVIISYLLKYNVLDKSTFNVDLEKEGI